MQNNYDYEKLIKLAYKIVEDANADAAENPTSDYIQVVIVEPFKKPFKQMIENTLEAKQKIVGGYIENVTIGETEKGARVAAIINEEGKLIDLPFNKRLIGHKGAQDVLVGNIIISAYNMQGDYISLTDDECKQYIKRFTALEVYI